MEDEIFLSIIVPIYNAEYTLERCLNSLIKQTYRNIEIILINDGSRDNSDLVIQKYIDKDSRIKRILTENRGVSAARNKGISIASGKYITFVDADDYIKEDMVEIIHQKIDKYKSDLIIYSYERETKYGNLKSIFCKSDYIIEKELLGEFKTNLLKGQHSQVWNKVYKKELLDKYDIQFNCNKSHGEDLEFNLSFCRFIKCAVIIPNILYHYIETNESTTRRYNPNIINMDIENYKTREKYIELYNINLGNEMRKILLNDTYNALFNEVNNISFNKAIVNINSILNQQIIKENINILHTNSKGIQNKFRTLILKNLDCKSIYIYIYIKYNINSLMKNIYGKINKRYNKKLVE